MPIGVRLVAGLFLFGMVMSALTALLLLVPATALDSLWRINPRARIQLESLGWAGIALMAAVSVACGTTARLLWLGRAWGRRLALGLLTASLLGDVGAGLARRDFRSLIGLPIGGALVAYLLNPRVRRHFGSGLRPPGGSTAPG